MGGDGEKQKGNSKASFNQRVTYLLSIKHQIDREGADTVEELFENKILFDQQATRCLSRLPTRLMFENTILLETIW